MSVPKYVGESGGRPVYQYIDLNPDPIAILVILAASSAIFLVLLYAHYKGGLNGS